MSITHHDRRDLRDEVVFLEEDLDVIEARILALITSGGAEGLASKQPRAARGTAREIKEWLERKRVGPEDGVTAPTRAKYRKILARLVETDPDNRERGSVELRVLLGAGSAAGVLAAAATPGHGILALALAPIIYDGYDAELVIELAAAA